jgi:anaerobic selenocysteine-containing dehydrogenase
MEIPEGMFAVATRRGKQFNTMVHANRDAITGAVRDAVLMNPDDAAGLGLRDGEAVILRSEIGEMAGRVYLAPVKPRNLQVHWPEGNVLLDHGRRSPASDVPDYNAFVRVERAAASSVAD